jgi:hypothetical protein
VTAASSGVDAIIPLAVLETVRWLDTPRPDDTHEFHAELALKRLGTSATVAAQIERFQTLARDGDPVASEEVEQFLRLAGRRADAALVFDAAGRRAAAHAAARVPAPARWTWRVGGPIRGAMGRRIAKRTLQQVFGLLVEPIGGGYALSASGANPAQALPGGVACGLYGAAAAALLRRFTGFEGAVIHESCRAAGAPTCVWRTLTRREE